LKCLGASRKNFQEFPETGLPDFSWYNKPKLGKMYQMGIKYTKMALIL
jgi:hypothetical protein